MGVIYFNADELPEQFHGLPKAVQEAAEMTLEACGAQRYGNWSVEGTVSEDDRDDDDTLVRLKVQLGSGETLDLSDRRVRDHGDPTDDYDHHYVVWHYDGMLGSGRVDEVHENGYVTLAVQGRY